MPDLSPVLSIRNQRMTQFKAQRLNDQTQGSRQSRQIIAIEKNLRGDRPTF